MKEISVKFVDFWNNFDARHFIKALSTKFKVNVLDENDSTKPDLVIYSAFGVNHYRYFDCVKVYYTGENDVPNFNECDYAISFHHLNFGDRHLRFPLYVFYENAIKQALCPPAITDNEALNRGFCTMLMRNYYNCNPIRLQIIDAVDNYKPLTYAGPYRNNIGGPLPSDDKVPFLAGYKFNLALENSAVPGYITEKIVEPFASPTVPIYWGAKDVVNDFNPEAFINVNDYDSIDSFISALKEIDNDDARYLKMLRAPRLNSDCNFDLKERFTEYLCGIADKLEIKRTKYGAAADIYGRDAVLKNKPKTVRVLDKLAKLMKYK